MKGNSSKNVVHSAKKHSGFTLVELVVVIAVLAILAGVGAVAYRGYIVYAKKGVDRQLVGEVKNAVSIEAQSDTAVLKLGVDDKAQAIGSIFISCPSKDSEEGSETSFSADPTGILRKALVSACGENFESVLQLKYDGWQSDGAAAGGFVDENGNRYLGAQELMDQLYKNSSVIFETIAKGTDNGDFKYGQSNGRVLTTVINLLNEDGTIDEILKQAGIENGVEGATRNSMRNAAIWAVAKYTSTHGDEVKNVLVKNPLDYKFSSLNGLSFPSGNGNGAGIMYGCLNAYTSLTMLVSYLDSTEEGSGIAAQVEGIMNAGKGTGGAAGLLKVVSEITQVQNLINENEELTRLAKAYYENGQAAKDAEAYLEMASHINDMQDTYNNSSHDLKGEKYFDENFIQELKKYTGETNGILITAYSDGTTVVSPTDADPVSKGSTNDAPAAPDPEGVDGEVADNNVE